MPGPIPKAVPVIRRLVRQSEQAAAPVSSGGTVLTEVPPHTIGGTSHTAVGSGWRSVLTADPTRGDILSAQGTTPAWASLTLGSPGQVLTAGADEPEWADATGIDPSTMSRLVAYMTAAMTAIGDASFVFVPFETVSDLVGTDIEVDGGDDTIINILTDGIYAITGEWQSYADTPANATAGYVSLLGSTPSGIFEGQPDVLYGGYGASPSLTQFLPAGTTLQIGGSLEGSTWTLQSGAISVQRIL